IDDHELRDPPRAVPGRTGPHRAGPGRGRHRQRSRPGARPPGRRRPVPVRARPDGSPLLLAATGSMLEQRLTTCPDAVTGSVPAVGRFAWRGLTGRAGAVAGDMAARITACAVALRSVEFGGAVPAEVAVEAFHAAAPDPLWRVAPGILEHLENGHMAELTGCV